MKLSAINGNNTKKNGKDRMAVDTMAPPREIKRTCRQHSSFYSFDEKSYWADGDEQADRLVVPMMSLQ